MILAVFDAKSRPNPMEAEPFLKRHKVLIECMALSFLAHLLFFATFNIADIARKPIPSYLRFTLLPIPSLWEESRPFAHGTSDPDRADTSFVLLSKIRGGAGPKLEVLRRQLLWEDEPENMAVFPSHPSVPHWDFQKEDADCSLLFAALHDHPSVLASEIARRLDSSEARRSSDDSVQGSFRISDSLQKRGLVHKDLSLTPEAEALSGIPRALRVSLAVDGQGNIRHIVLERGSGDARLDASAVAAVSKWRFSSPDSDSESELLWGWVELSLPAHAGASVSPPAESPEEKKKAN